MDDMKNTGHSRSWFIAITLLGIAVAAFLALSVEKVVAPTIETALSGMNVQWWFTAGATLLIFIILNLVISTASIRRFVANFFIIIGFKVLLSAATTLVFLTHWDMQTALQKATFFSPLTALVQVVGAFLLTLFLNGFYYAEDEMEEEIAAHFARPQIKLPEMEETEVHEQIIQEELSLAPISDSEKTEIPEKIITAETVVASAERKAESTEPEVKEEVTPVEVKEEISTTSEIAPSDGVMYKEPEAETPASSEKVFLSQELEKRYEIPRDEDTEEIARYRDAILIRVDSILAQVPSEELAMTVDEIRSAVGGEGLLPFPAQEILDQISEGVVYWDASDALARMPEGALKRSPQEVAGQIATGKIILPLDEIIRQIPFEKLAVTSKTTDEAGDEMPDVFTEAVTDTEKEKSAEEPVSETIAEPELVITDEPAVAADSQEEKYTVASDKEEGKQFVKISCGSIIKQIPTEEVVADSEDVLKMIQSREILFPLDEILPQLAEGVVTVDAANTLSKLPQEILKRPAKEIAESLPSGKISLPLDEIIPQVPSEYLVPSSEVIETTDNYPDIFKEATVIEEEAVSQEDKKPVEEIAIAAREETESLPLKETTESIAPSESKDDIYIRIESIISQIPTVCLKKTVDEIKSDGLTRIGLPLKKVMPMLENGQVEWDAEEILSKLPADALSFPANEAAKSVPNSKFILPLDEIISQVPAESLKRSYSVAEDDSSDIPDMFVEAKYGETSKSEEESAEPAPAVESEELQLIQSNTDVEELEKAPVEMPAVEIQTPEDVQAKSGESEPEEAKTEAPASVTEPEDVATSPDEIAVVQDDETSELAESASEETEPIQQQEPVEETISAEPEPVSVYDIDTKTTEIAETETGLIEDEKVSLPVEIEEVKSKEARAFEELESDQEIEAKMDYEEATAKIAGAFASTEEREIPLGEVMRGAFGPYPEGYVKSSVKSETPSSSMPEIESFDLSEDCVKVSANYILSQLPPDSLGMSIDQIITKLRTPGKVMVPQRIVIPQLSEGVIEIEFLQLVPQFPPKAFIQPVEKIAKSLPHEGKVELQLKEVITQLPLDVFSGYEHKKPEEDVSDIPEPFEGFFPESFHKKPEPSGKTEETGKDLKGAMQGVFKESTVEQPAREDKKETEPSGEIEYFKLAKDTEPLPEAFKMDLSSLDFVPEKIVTPKTTEQMPTGKTDEEMPSVEKKEETVSPEMELSKKETLPVEKKEDSLFAGFELDEKPAVSADAEKIEFVGLTAEREEQPQAEETKEEKPKVQGSALTEDDIKEIEELLEHARKQEEVKEERLSNVMKSSAEKQTLEEDKGGEEEMENIIQTPSRTIEEELEALPPIEPVTESIQTGYEAIAFDKNGNINTDDVKSYFSRLNLINGGIYSYDGLNLIVLTDEDTSCDAVAGNAGSIVSMLNDFGKRYGIGTNRKVIAVGQNGAVAAVSTLKSSGTRYVIAAEHDSGMAGQMSIFMEKQADILEPVFKKGATVAKRLALVPQGLQPIDVKKIENTKLDKILSLLSESGIDSSEILDCAEGQLLALFYVREFPGRLFNTGEQVFSPSLFAKLLNGAGFGSLKSALMIFEKFTLIYVPVSKGDASGVICVFPGAYKEGLAKRKADKAAALCVGVSGKL